MSGLMEFRIGQTRRGEDLDQYRENWDRIFGKKEPQPSEESNGPETNDASQEAA